MELFIRTTDDFVTRRHQRRVQGKVNEPIPREPSKRQRSSVLRVVNGDLRKSSLR